MIALRTTLQLMFALLIASPLIARAEVAYTQIDVPGSTFTIVYGINSSGEMVGSYKDAQGTFHGFLLSSGVFTFIDFPGATSTVATGVNDSGLIVGYAVKGGANHGFLLEAQTFTSIQYPGARGTMPMAINNAGHIVGGYGIDERHTGAFEFDGNNYTAIDPPTKHTTVVATGINNSDEITGYVNITGLIYKGFRYGHGMFGAIEAPGGQFTIGWGVNDSGTIVGYHGVITGESGFALRNGRFLRINFPGTLGLTQARSIDVSGRVVGNYGDAEGIHGFVTDPI